MTPEQKAKELTQKFRIFVGTSLDDDGGTVNNYLIGKVAAKKSAIICVAEIIEELRKHNDVFGFYFDENGKQSLPERIMFYHQVIECLKK